MRRRKRTQIKGTSVITCFVNLVDLLEHSFVPILRPVHRLQGEMIYNRMNSNWIDECRSCNTVLHDVAVQRKRNVNLS